MFIVYSLCKYVIIIYNHIQRTTRWRISQVVVYFIVAATSEVRGLFDSWIFQGLIKAIPRYLSQGCKAWKTSKNSAAYILRKLCSTKNVFNYTAPALERNWNKSGLNVSRVFVQTKYFCRLRSVNFRYNYMWICGVLYWKYILVLLQKPVRI